MGVYLSEDELQRGAARGAARLLVSSQVNSTGRERDSVMAEGLREKERGNWGRKIEWEGVEVKHFQSWGNLSKQPPRRRQKEEAYPPKRIANCVQITQGKLRFCYASKRVQFHSYLP